MCTGVILVVFLLVLHVYVLYWLLFLLDLHVYLCYIGCSFFQFYMCIGVILAVLPFSFTCV